MNVDSNNPPDNLKVFAALCESRALLWSANEWDLQDAVDALEGYLKKLGIDADTAQLIMARAFAPVRSDLGGWRP